MNKKMVSAACGLNLLSAPFTTGALSQDRGEIDLPINLKVACSEIRTQEGIADCQAAFEIAGNRMRARQIALFKEPYIEKYGRVDNSINFVASDPSKMAMHVATPLNGHCVNLAHKDQRNPNSESLVDGRIHSLHRIAERAGICAERVNGAVQASKVPIAISYQLSELGKTAMVVRAATNKIAFGY